MSEPMTFSEFCDQVDGGSGFNDTVLRRLFDFLVSTGADVRSVLEGKWTQPTSAAFWLNAICSEFEASIAEADNQAAGRKGMQVPFHGDFASALKFPSVVGRMRWWVREMRGALDGKPSPDLGPLRELATEMRDYTGDTDSCWAAAHGWADRIAAALDALEKGAP